MRAKLLAFSLFLVVVPGLTFAFLAFSTAHDALRDAAGSQLVEAARDQADAISMELDRLREDLHRLSANETMRELLIGDIDKRVSRLLWSVKREDERYFELFCLGDGGRVVAASGPEWIGHRLEATRADLPAVGFRGPLLRDPYPRAFVEAIESISDPDQPNARIGTLAAWYDLGVIDESAAALQANLAELGAMVDVLVIDSTGTVIGGAWQASGRDLRGRNLRDEGWQTAAVSLPHGRGFVEEASAGVFAGHSEVAPQVGGWRVLVAQPVDQALAPVSGLRRRWIVALVVIIIVALLLARLLAERMVRPLQALTEAARNLRLTAGDVELLPVTTSDETGELTRAFNKMSEELRGARRELINAARLALVGEMAAGIAHEVRTPLGILRTSAQVLKRSIGDRDPKEVELADMLVDETDRLSRVVSELLDLARPRSPSSRSTPLGPVLERAVEFVRAQAEEKGVQLRLDIDPDASPAWCDTEQIYQVALNLVINAVQSLESGGSATVRLADVDSTMVGFEITDDGPGIPEDIQESIFAPFFTTRESGTGLGLALVERIVASHGGAISVTSRPGEGAAFRVVLPVAQEVV